MNRIIISLFVSVCSLIMGFDYAESQPEEEVYQMSIPGGSTVADYQLISFPVKPLNDQDPWTNEDILIDDLGPYDPYYWRFFRWDPTLNGSLGDYIELNQREGQVTWGSDQNIDYGRGYWIISVETRTVDIVGVPDGSTKTIILYKGWNQIGNPFYDMQSSLNVGPVDGPYVPIHDVLNFYTDKFVWDWVGGEYQITTGPLEVGKGYWIKNITEGFVELQFVPYEPSSSEVKSTPKYLSILDLQEVEEPPAPPSTVESPSSSSSGGSGGCFIATAAYGDYDHPMVQLMREFRDRYLLTNSFGRAFVDLYYRYSPALARFVADSNPSKILIRFSLMPVIATSAIVSKMNICGFLIAVAFCFLGSLFFFKRRTGAWGEWECKLKFWGKMREKGRK